MSSTFHLAIPVSSIKEAEKFYCDMLGCEKGNYEAGKWQDINFWGNELTLHEADHGLQNERHDVDMGSVPVPHFGVHLEPKVFDKIKVNLEKNKIDYLDKPYTRFDGKAEQQETFFIKDPHGNILELKTLKNSH